MVTSLTLSYVVEDADVGYAIGDHETIVAGDEIPVYIPKLMSSIPRSNKKETNLKCIDTPRYIFINASQCMPTSKTLLTERNYILAKALDNCDYSKGIKDGQKLSILYANDSVREIYFNTDIKEK